MQPISTFYSYFSEAFCVWTETNREKNNEMKLAESGRERVRLWKEKHVKNVNDVLIIPAFIFIYLFIYFDFYWYVYAFANESCCENTRHTVFPFNALISRLFCFHNFPCVCLLLFSAVRKWFVHLLIFRLCFSFNFNYRYFRYALPRP